ncbi:MAG: hypothetical protein E6G48_05310 [Actinobacteria bacterium]|nr:MAG: hypothetical protein E6G48_05310 [Actinomycetota bacterium]
MPERINGGQALVVVAAIGLIVSLFLDWYAPGVSAWTAFEIVDLLLAALAVTALVIAIGGAIHPEGSLAALTPRWLPAIGIAAFVIVIAALINHPPTAIHRSAETGTWIALGAAGALTVGGILSAARVSLVITLRPREEDTEWSDAAPAAANPDEAEPYEEAAEEEYADEYAETEYIDAEDSNAEYAEAEPTSEIPLAEEERG